MPTPALTRDILLAALAGFQLDKQRIDAKIDEVQAMLNGGSPKNAPIGSEEAPTKGTRKRSAAVRKRMAEAQKARWAKIKGESEPSSDAGPPKRKKFSAAARRRMAEAQRLRYLKPKGETESVSPEPPTPEAPKAKRQISPEGMENIIAATKKRRRLQRAAAKSALQKKAASKKAVVKKATAKVLALKKSATKKTDLAVPAVELAAI
jgi:hypothetical protein